MNFEIHVTFDESLVTLSIGLVYTLYIMVVLEENINRDLKYLFRHCISGKHIAFFYFHIYIDAQIWSIHTTKQRRDVRHHYTAQSNHTAAL